MCQVKKIEIPFLESFKEDMLTDNKTATTRNKKYGKKGDRFKAFNDMFELTHIVEVPLVFVSGFFYKEEGFKNSAEFIDCWRKIHPRKGYVPDQIAWLHLFMRVTDVSR